MRSAVLASLCVLLSAAAAHSQDIDQRMSLKGLPGVYVNTMFQGEDEYSSRSTFTKQQVQTDVELRLRKAGIRVLTKEEMENIVPFPSLIVRVALFRSIHRDLSDLYAFSIDVNVSQYVRLTNGRNVLAPTWSQSTMGLTGNEHVGELKSYVSNLVDEFINDYLAANPTKSKP